MPKRCPRCERCLPLEAFSRNHRYKSGRSSWCRECAVEATRQWRERNQELVQWMNERRRLGERERECVDCSQTFTFKSTVAVRCSNCRRRRKLEQRRAPA